jgi:hypothetical protein
MLQRQLDHLANLIDRVAETTDVVVHAEKIFRDIALVAHALRGTLIDRCRNDIAADERALEERTS